MDEFLDIVWFKIEAVILGVMRVMDAIVSPFNALGPTTVIFMLVFVTVCITKLLKRFYSTKRYEALKNEFNHWSEVRKQALGVEDREKGKRLARNIDQAKLNKVYYDYFFEGFLNNILTTVLPVLLMASYVNEAYNANKLLNLFDRSYVFKVTGFGGDPIHVSALLWFVLSLIFIHIFWYIALRWHKNKK